MIKYFSLNSARGLISMIRNTYAKIHHTHQLSDIENFPYVPSKLSDLNDDINGIIPSGMIMMWSGLSSNIPNGWLLCDGSNGTPNLINRFVLGAGANYKEGRSGGSNTHTHSYGFQYGGYYRSISLEANTNAGLVNYSPDGTKEIVNVGTSDGVGAMVAPVNSSTTKTITEDASMNHYLIEANTSYDSTLPPYYTLCYVMKV